METNEFESINSTNDTEVKTADTQSQDEMQSDVTPSDESVQETPEAKRARLERQLNQHLKKHFADEFESKKSKVKESGKNTGELDYGQKAFLVANGVKASDEIDLVRDIMKNTGKTIEQVLESKYFTSELNELRELKKTADATPSGTKRSASSPKDSVEYWIAKGELPEDREMRSKVVKAKWKRDSSVNPFG